MDFQIRMTKLKNVTLKKIEDAAKIRNTASVVSNGRVLEEVENLENKFNQLVASLEMLEKTAGKNLKFTRFDISTIQQNRKISHKKRGELIRSSFIGETQKLGFSISKVKGVRYKINNNNLIGIAYSSERRLNRWFLGLPSENFYTIILLCERTDGKILNFIFSGDFFQKIKNHLSTDEHGQLKYNISFKNTDYQLIVPQMGNENINMFLDNFDNLK